MIEIFLSFLFLASILTFSGLILSKILFKNIGNIIEIDENAFLGIIFFTFLSFFLHFFFPLNEITNIITIIIITIFSLLNYRNINSIISSINLKFLLTSLVVIFLMTLKYNPNEDYGYYHLPYIISLISKKIVFGLSHLQVNFAWNSTWLNFSSMLYVPILKLKGTQLSNSVLYFYVLYFFLRETFKYQPSFNLSKIYIIFFSSYFIIKFSRISEHGFDLPANFFLLLSFYYFIKLFEENEKIFIKKYFLLLCLFSLFSLTIKLSTFAAPFLILPSIIYLIKKNINFYFIKNSIIFISFFFLFWFIQQIIYSGCLNPFFKFTCVEELSWYNEGISNAVGDATGAVNKSFNEYSGNLEREQYIQNFNWVPTWFNRNKIEILEHFVAFVIPAIFLIILNLQFNQKKFKKISLTINEKKLFFISGIIFFLFGLSIWFLKSPVIRFGIPYIFIGLFYFTIFILTSTSIKRENLKKSFMIVIIFSILFNVLKNTSRILNSNNDFWPKILSVNYSSLKKDNFIINYPDPKNNFHKLKYCWSIPFICHMGGGDNLNFQKKNGYIFIEKEKTE